MANTVFPVCVTLSLRATRPGSWSAPTMPKAKAEVAAGNTVTATPIVN
jgi:hypothetical protein